MATRLIAPSTGEGIEELTINNWLKKEGDPVEEFEVIVELETDKVTTGIPSPVKGTLLKILVGNDKVAKVGSTLAWIGEPGEVLESSLPSTPSVVIPSKPTPSPVVASITPGKTEYTGPVSPLVKKMVEINHIDLNLVQGTGQDGRITKDDIQNYLETRKETPPKLEVKPTEPGVAPAPEPATKSMPLAGELIPITSLRRQIAERMVLSKHTSPHVLTVMEADLTKVLAHRATNKAAFAAQGVNLTLTAYFTSAIISGLKACPDVNSSWTEEGIQRHSEINLGIATSLGDEGLIVPVIKNADLLSLLGLAQKINDLSGRARAKKLLPDEVRGGTFTLTNHGSSGSLFASPIILQPQAAILGTGVMQKRVVVVSDSAGNDSIGIRPMIYLSLVFDHRILDGASGDRFLARVKEALDNWS